MYSIDYVQNIFDNINNKQDGNAPLAVQKNNWLHPNMDHFSKHLCRNLDFFTGHHPISNNMFEHPILNLKTQLKHKYSILHSETTTITSSQTSQVTPCSIAVCKSIGTVATDEVYHVIFDSGSSKTLIHKHVKPCTYTTIQSNDNLKIFSLIRSTVFSNLVAIHKIWFPEFNHNMINKEHPALIVDSKNISCDIIFGLVLISLINTELHLITMPIKFAGWNMIFPFVTLFEFLDTVTIHLLLYHLRQPMKMTSSTV